MIKRHESDLPARALDLSARDRAAVYSLFLAVLCTLPAIVHSQWITGPIVNAALFVSAVLLGPREAVSLGIIPSVVALGAGLLPSPLAPAVPVIAASNTVLVLVFLFSRGGFAARAAVAAAAKFAVIYCAVRLIFEIIMGVRLPAGMSFMMGWPQLATALAGGLIAYIVLALLRKYGKS